MAVTADPSDSPAGQVERNRDYGELSLVINRERGRRLLEVRERTERNLHAVRGMNVDVGQVGRDSD